MSTFEIYKDKKGETRFRYRAGNGEVVFSSEGYKAKASAMKAIESIKKNAPTAVIEEAVAKAPVKAKPVAAKAATAVKAAADTKKAAPAKAAAKPAAKVAAKPVAKAAAKPKASAK